MNRRLNAPKILETLDKLGWSRSDLAEHIGVSRQAISQWFKAEKYPRPRHLLKIATSLDLTFEDIVIKEVDGFEPVIAFRKKGRHKITEDYIKNTSRMGKLLENLVPYLTFESRFTKAASLKNPILEYEYIHEVAAGIRESINSDHGAIPFDNLIKCFAVYNAVIIPVLWGSKDNHENALHVYLPRSMTTWIYLNLDSNIHDFKFWMAHELGHVNAPELNEDEGEDFADAFAGALLIDVETAKQTYFEVKKLRTKPHRISRIKKVAAELLISPITVYLEMNRYADFVGEEQIDLDSRAEIYRASTVFNKQYPTVAEFVFKKEKPTTREYIESPRNLFDSNFFDILREYLAKERKSPGYIQNILNIPLADAQQIYQELW